MSDKMKCPIWGTAATLIDTKDYGDKVTYDSPRAGGTFTLTGTGASMISSLTEAERISVTQWIVEQINVGADAYITSNTLKDIRNQELPAPENRAELLLRYLTRSSEHLGQSLEYEISQADRVYGEKAGTFTPLLAWSASKKIEEVLFLLRFLEARKFVSLDHGKTTMSAKRLELVVQPEGYAFLSDKNAHASDSRQAFIAMWFDGAMDDAYENGFEKAIREAGYEPLRIDCKEHINKIDDEIIADIRRSRFVVADFTSETLSHNGEDKHIPRGGVYFEAGYAMGMQIPVIWTCRKDLINDIHFDTRQFNHITWETPDDLAEKLKNRIEAVIGEGPLKIEMRD